MSMVRIPNMTNMGQHSFIVQCCMEHDRRVGGSSGLYS